VKFKSADVINLLPNGDNVQVLVTGTVATTIFEGIDTIRVIKWSLSINSVCPHAPLLAKGDEGGF
jgi:hypothetical protein